MIDKAPLEQRTLPAQLVQRAEEDPHAIFLSDEAGSLTWAEALTLARAMSGGFHRLGVERGEPVVLLLDNRREFLASWFGLATLGAVQTPMNPQTTDARLVHVFNNSQARTAVVQAEYLPALEDCADRLPHLERVIVVGEATTSRWASVLWRELPADEQAAPGWTPGPGDPVALLYTSGSTGPAKGALLPHGQHYINGWQAAWAARLTPADTSYVCLPLFHNMAQGYGVMPAVVAGARVHLAPRFDRHRFWDEVCRSGATVFPFIGAMLALLANLPGTAADHRLRVGYGVPVAAALQREFEERFGLRLLHCYGSTEATIVAWQSLDKPAYGSCGPVLPDFTVELRDDGGNPVKSGDPGEIWIRAHEPFSRFLGYHRDPERTASAMRGDWFLTGDVGRFDADGNLWFLNRKGDVIRCKGEFVSAPEIEEVVAAHPQVQQASAIGVPSELGEEEVMVVVVRAPGGDVTARELAEWCAGRIPRFAMPRYIEFVDELPMTGTGKIEKYRLRERGVTDRTVDLRTRVTGGAQ